MPSTNKHWFSCNLVHGVYMCYSCHPPLSALISVQYIIQVYRCAIHAIHQFSFLHSFPHRHLLHIITWTPSAASSALLLPCLMNVMYPHAFCSHPSSVRTSRHIIGNVGYTPWVLCHLGTLPHGNVASYVFGVHIFDCRAWCHLVPPGYTLPLPDENSFNSTWQFRVWYLLTDDWLVYAVPRLTTVVP